MELHVVGVEHYSDGLRSRPSSDSAVLVREPQNRHDANAVAVYVDGVLRGYLSQQRAAQVRGYLDELGPVEVPFVWESPGNAYVTVPRRWLSGLKFNLRDAHKHQAALLSVEYGDVDIVWDDGGATAFHDGVQLGRLNLALEQREPGDLESVRGVTRAAFFVNESRFREGEVYGSVMFHPAHAFKPVSFTPPARRTSTGYPHLGIAYLVWFLTGILGGHHYYLKRWGWGIAYTLTAGFVGLGWIADAFRLPRLVRGR